MSGLVDPLLHQLHRQEPHGTCLLAMHGWYASLRIPYTAGRVNAEATLLDRRQLAPLNSVATTLGK